MNLSDLQKVKFQKKKSQKIVGRGNGSGKGKTCGRGTKGQKCRAGYSRKYFFEGGQMPLYRRLPKRGFNNPVKKNYALVNVGSLEKFEANSEIGPKDLLIAGVLKNLKDGLKILGEGEVTKPLTVLAHKFSKSAREKIEKVGGKIVVISS